MRCPCIDYPIALTDVRKGYLPTASTIVWELHKDEGDTEPHIKTFIWWPTQERGEKERSIGKDNPLLMQTVKPQRGGDPKRMQRHQVSPVDDTGDMKRTFFS
ncbi:unnamed protein product [Vitrella brassicaformis CCMP3155]|uniref:Uncharacterized protein n=1 Tax=Vitrella brassicaformis (strain CCMP3155) TaxID=1169540 RepID=A0A0G4GMV1_VITBC|nr:unnamed protein product [Vitrella brassicaformis CCMP3155]|eukprot:CEM31535.1 unnamed protein product [Vitrella brassicaformis CCMP3155]